MKNLLLIGLTFFVLACKTNNLIVGTYADSTNPDSFEFKEDHTFMYLYGAFHSKKYSDGTWKHYYNDQIILNSFIKDKHLSIDVIEEKDNKRQLWLKCESSEKSSPADYRCEVFINNILFKLNSQNELVSTGLSDLDLIHEVNPDNIFYRYIRCDSLNGVFILDSIKNIFFKIIKQPIKPISTEVYNEPLYTNAYLLQSGKNNSLRVHVKINDSLFNYKIFDSLNVFVKRKGIYYSESGSDKKFWLPLK